MNILEGKQPIDLGPEPSRQEHSSGQKNYSKAFMRDYQHVKVLLAIREAFIHFEKENPFTKAYYDRKMVESQYSKYEEKILEISNMIKDMGRSRLDPSQRDKLREALNFLIKAQSQYSEVSILN